MMCFASSRVHKDIHFMEKQRKWRVNVYSLEVGNINDVFKQAIYLLFD